MSIQYLSERAGVLNQELQRAKQNVTGLTEQLEQAKVHLNMVVGHLNEVGFLIGEEQKANQAVMDAAPVESKEPEHVETNNQEQGQAPQE